MKQILLRLSALLVILAVTFLPASLVRAANIGGRTLFKMYCPCSFSELIVVGPPVGGLFIITPATKLFDYKKVAIPNWNLGSALSIYVPCLIPALVGCVPVAFGKPVIYEGTSSENPLGF